MSRIFVALVFVMVGAVSARAQVFIPYFYAIPSVVPDAEPGKYDAIHTIAIISALGPKMELVAPNGGIIGRSRELDIAEWKLDDEISRRIAAYLGVRFTVYDVAYDRAALSKIPNGTLSNSNSALRTYLRALPNDSTDAFVVVRPDQESYTPGTVGLALEIDDGRATEWANYEIDIVDAHNYARLGKAYSRVQFRVGDKPHFAGLRAGRNLVLGSALALSEMQMDELKRDMFGLTS